MDGNEYRVSGCGQVFEAAPASAKGLPEPKPIAGSSPRYWETRKFGECASIVGHARDDRGFPRHLACCLPIKKGQGDKVYQYCAGHWPHQPLKKTQKEFVKGLRRYI